MNENNYDDIINLPHHVSKKHKRMSVRDRAAQFAPFSALTGFDKAIDETARQTEERIDLDESEKLAISETVGHIIVNNTKPAVTVTYFIPDELKSGGKYTTVTARFRKYDEENKSLILENNIRVPVEEVIYIKINKS